MLEAVRHPRGSRSLSSHLQSRLGLKKARNQRSCTNALRVKTWRRKCWRASSKPRAHPDCPRPLDEAISSADGVLFEALDEHLMLRPCRRFCAGEMLDWEAPTGGYLLTGCLSGYTAGQAFWLF